MVLVVFIAGICINGVSASKTIKMKGYKVKFSNKDIKNLKKHKYWHILKSTHKKLKDRKGWEDIYEPRQVTKYKYKDIYINSWEAPEGYEFWGRVERNGYWKNWFRSINKVAYTEWVDVKVGRKPFYKKGVVKIGLEKDGKKVTAYLINDYIGSVGDAGYRVMAKKRVKL